MNQDDNNQEHATEQQAENTQPDATAPVMPTVVQPNPKSGKFGNKKKALLLVVMILILASVGVWYLVNKSSPAPSNQTTSKTVIVKKASLEKQPYVVFIDSADKSITVADKNLKQVYALNYKTMPYATFTSSSPSGSLLFFLTNSVSDVNQQYLLVDKSGKQQEINADAQKVLLSANGNRGGGTIYLKSSTEALLTVCSYQVATKNNKCNLVQLNISDGTSQTVLSITSPVASDTGDALFAIKGLSSDGSTAYLEVAGPTDFGSSQYGIYSVNLQTAKPALVTKLSDSDIGITTVSPSGNKLVYASRNGQQTTIHALSTKTGKESTVDNKGRDFVIDSNMWSWSPDESKLLFYSYQTGNPEPSYGPTSYSYLDITKSTITDLQTITDTAHQLIGYQAWLDNNSIVYDYLTTTNPHNFSESKPQVFTQKLTDSKPSLQNVNYGLLSQVVFY